MTPTTKVALKTIATIVSIIVGAIAILALVGSFVFDVQSKELATVVHDTIKATHQASKDEHVVEHKDLKKDIDGDLKDVLKRVDTTQAEQRRLSESVLKMETRLVREIRKVQK